MFFPAGLVINLLLPDWRSGTLLIPYELSLGVEARAFIGHWNHLAAVSTFLSTHASFVSGDPQERGWRSDGRMVVSVSLGYGVVYDLWVASGDKTA